MTTPETIRRLSGHPGVSHFAPPSGFAKSVIGPGEFTNPFVSYPGYSPAAGS
jgi:hypothetical protein